MGTEEEWIGPLGHWLATGAQQNHLPGGGVEGKEERVAASLPHKELSLKPLCKRGKMF